MIKLAEGYFLLGFIFIQYYDVLISSYKKTQETLSHAGQKATAAISNVGTVISKKFGDMRYSNWCLISYTEFGCFLLYVALFVSLHGVCSLLAD